MSGLAGARGGGRGVGLKKEFLGGRKIKGEKGIHIRRGD